MKYHDYYKTLGVKRSATDKQIKSAYRKRARKYHPDVYKGSDGDKKIKEINEAYEVLGDPEKRKRYDALGANWNDNQNFTPPPGFESVFKNRNGGFSYNFKTNRRNGGSAGFSDFFESFFGDSDIFSQFSSPHQRSTNTKGQDRKSDITISLEDAYNGCEKNIVLSSLSENGTVQRSNYKVKIPAHICDGQKIRLSGQGEKGYHNNPGDLYITVHIQKHPLYTIQENDLSIDIPVYPWEAALGITVEVPTLKGAVNLKIPAGSNTGKKLRLKGYGLKDKKGNIGSLYAVIKIVIPEEISSEQQELYKKLAADHPHSPRSF